MLLLLLHHHHHHHRRRRVAASRSRGSSFAFSALAVPSSSSSFVHLIISRTVIFSSFRTRAFSDTISVREFAIFASLSLFSVFRSSSFSLSLAVFFVLRRNRDTDRKPSPRHFCDYPRRSPRRVSYNTHPLSRFRWRFTNSAYYPEPTRSTFF